MDTVLQHKAQELLTKLLPIWTAVETEKKSGRGRGSSNGGSIYGIKKLRELILELAVRGQLVPQDPQDEPASELLKCIWAEKDRLVAEGKLRKEKLLAPIAEDEKPFELPQGWGWVRFGDISQHNSGKTLDKGRNKGVYRDYITTSNLYWGNFELSSVRQMPIAENELEKCSAKKGDLLICEGGEAGRAAVWPYEHEVCFQNHVHRARFYCEINPYFAYRFFEKLDVTGEINQYRKGVAISNMSGKSLASIVFPLPPLAEQHRIVAKVDELMALCDQLENQHGNAAEAHETLVSELLGTLTRPQEATEFQAGWQRIAAHFDLLFTTDASMDALKQTILQLAVMGKLVPQDQRDEPASELLKRIQAEKARLVTEGKIKKDKPLAPIGEDEKPFALPQGWEWVRPEDFSLKITDGEHFRPQTQERGIFFLSAKDVREDGVSLDDPLFISEETARKALQRCNPEYGDLLIVSRGATVGRMCKVNIQDKFCLLGSVILVKPTSLVLSDYLSFSLKSPSTFKLLINASGSTAQPAIYLKDLKEITLSLPPITEQHRIVAKVDELMALCDQLQARLAAARQQQQLLADALAAQAVAA